MSDVNEKQGVGIASAPETKPGGTVRAGRTVPKSLPHPTTASMPEECVFVLTDEERNDLQECCARITRQDAAGLQRLDDPFFLMLEGEGDGMPKRLRDQLRRLRFCASDHGALLIRNGPVDPELPATPSDGGAAQDKHTFVSETYHLLVLTRPGDPRGYLDEKNGAIIQSVSPVRGAERKQENTGSLAILEAHTEDGFLVDMADFLGLFCLRSDHDRVARTGVASARNAIGRVPGTYVEWLRKPVYRIALPSSFMTDATREPQWSQPMPVLSGDLLRPALRIDLDPNSMRCDIPEAEVALQAFSEALMQVVVDCVLTPGDLLIIDNRAAVHTRTAFQPRFDGSDRWLQRIKVVTDPRASQGERWPGQRVVGSLALSRGKDCDIPHGIKP